MADYSWSLSTTWQSACQSALESLVKNTFLNSRKGEAAKLDADARVEIGLNGKAREKAVKWNTKPVTSVASSPLAALLGFKEAAKHKRSPSPILSSKRRPAKKPPKTAASEGSSVLGKLPRVVGKEESLSSLSSVGSPTRKAGVGRLSPVYINSAAERKNFGFFAVGRP